MTGWRARCCRRTRRSTATPSSPPPPAHRPLGEAVPELTALGFAATLVMARAIARGVHAATALPVPGAQPAWRDRFGATPK